MISAKTIGRTVKTYRRARKLTQAQLGEVVGRTPDAISQIERGVNVPNIETLAALSGALFVSIDDLIFPEATADHSDRQTQLRRALAVMSKLSDRDLEIAVKQLEAF